MGLLKRIALASLVVSVAPAAWALDWELDVDARAVYANSSKSFFDGGLGKLRYNDGSTFQLGRARLGLEQRLGESFRVVIDASAWGDHGPHPVDLSEAYIEYRPFPRDGWRTRLRAGAFYPPSSLENRAAGWESPYSISASALNSWIGEEIRAIGLEGSVDHLGSKLGGSNDIGLFAGVFGWNDPAGVLIVSHGFALHDRQTSLHANVGPRGNFPVSDRQLFYEIDGRPGYYVGGRWKYLEHVEARAMHYDNRADPTVPKPTIQDFAWNTQFDTVGVRYESERELTLLGEWLEGTTAVAPYTPLFRWRFRAWDVLANKRVGSQALTLRYDHFDFRQTLFPFGPLPAADHGSAWTLAYALEREGSPWRIMAELQRIRSTSTDRVTILGLAPDAIDSKVELSIRYRFSGKALQR